MAWWHRAKIGDKIVCIDSEPKITWWINQDMNGLKVNNVYSIRHIGICPVWDCLSVWLNEINRPIRFGSEVGYAVERFRPVKDTSLEVEKLKALLHKKPATEKLPIVAETDLADEWKPEELEA